MTQTLADTTARNFVGGAWLASLAGETYEKRNPWRPSEVTGTFAASSPDDARAAVDAARDAFAGWSAARRHLRVLHSSSRLPMRSRRGSSGSRRT